METIPFIKMHGLGNDFVVIDARRAEISLSPDQVRAIADRHTGVGCDQLIVIGPGRGVGTEATMHIRNADGSVAGACGNAARCVGWLLMREARHKSVAIATDSGPVLAEATGDMHVTVDMGLARTGWREIPLARELDTLHLGLSAGPLSDPVGVSMGNPHAVFFVPDAAAVDLAALGPGLENDPLFPEKANIGVAQVVAPDRIRLRVWERGAGLTRACGTGACAAAVAAHRRGLAERAVTVALDGGELAIRWRGDGHVLMGGPVAVSFTGELAGEMEGALLA